MTNIIIVVSSVVAYFLCGVCFYFYARYAGEDDADAFGWALAWPFLAIAYPCVCLIGRWYDLGRYFANLGEKHRKGKK
jgi:type IV secretory pathway VirB3-like protein